MNLGFDIDGVIANFSDLLIQAVKKNFGLNLKPKDIYCFDLNLILGITKAEENQLVNEVLKTDLQLYLNAKETLKQLNREGHSIFLLTGRYSHLRDLTQSWLKEKDVPYTQLHLLNLGEKYRANIEPLDVVVEDSLEEALEWTTKVKNVLVYDQLWNRTLNIKNLIKRVYNWKEIHYEIQQLIDSNKNSFAKPTKFGEASTI